MMLVERVSEAQRFARLEMKEQGEKRKRPRGGDPDNDDTEQASGVRKKVRGGSGAGRGGDGGGRGGGGMKKRGAAAWRGGGR
ncbi:hypothetical protein PBY51_008357 [Eleginops maclovinus]|uniref:Uncharacterized protein n=2 Tax=Eleginops maclovinus TaxID=56733 RepID=A0AAN7X854_ELEMC|nr:hypothetical protein PBY51_008357 [Eleginops maclovinus]